MTSTSHARNRATEREDMKQSAEMENLPRQLRTEQFQLIERELKIKHFKLTERVFFSEDLHVGLIEDSHSARRHLLPSLLPFGTFFTQFFCGYRKLPSIRITRRYYCICICVFSADACITCNFKYNLSLYGLFLCM